MVAIRRFRFVFSLEPFYETGLKILSFMKLGFEDFLSQRFLLIKIDFDNNVRKSTGRLQL
jgi:hypothetical protein